MRLPGLPDDVPVFDTVRRRFQRMGLAVATAEGRLLTPGTVQRVLSATCFYEWAISTAEYGGNDTPMNRRPDPARGFLTVTTRSPEGPARQQPVRRTVRVRLPVRLPRPMTSSEIEALLEV